MEVNISAKKVATFSYLCLYPCPCVKIYSIVRNTDSNGRVRETNHGPCGNTAEGGGQLPLTELVEVQSTEAQEDRSCENKQPTIAQLGFYGHLGWGFEGELNAKLQ